MGLRDQDGGEIRKINQEDKWKDRHRDDGGLPNETWQVTLGELLGKLPGELIGELLGKLPSKLIGELLGELPGKLTGDLLGKLPGKPIG